MNSASAQKRFLALLRSCTAVFTLTAACLQVQSAAAADNPGADNPGEALQRQFAAAKSSLAANDLPRAEQELRLPIGLGLQQLGNLAISEQQFDEATTLLDEAVKVSPADPALQVEDAVAWFRKG